MKKLVLTILVVSLFVMPGLIWADNNTTISYLQSQNQNTWTSQALASAEVADIDISYMDYQTNDLMTAAKNVLTLAATNSQDHENLNQLVSVIEDSKEAGQFGSLDLVNDDFWALLALASVNKLADTATVKSFVLSNQNNDGGWSWAATGASDSNDTAAAIMALYDLGYDSSSPEIVSALAYLQNTQNDDGGFGYDSDSESDGASTAWIIIALNKFGISASSWEKNSNNPVNFLESLRQDDGSFLWMPSDEEASAMVTAYALVALTNSSYPINYIEISSEDNSIIGHSLRIEGPDNTICLADKLEANTVLELLEVGANICGFEYTTQDSAYGVYVSAIDGISGAGMEGWQYFVDWQSGMLAVADYNLSGHQEVLWAYGGFPFYPVKLEVNNTHFDIGDNLLASFNYYDGQSWLPVSEKDIIFGTDTYQTNNLGQFTFTITNNGVYPIYSKQFGEFVRSNKEYIVVGDGISQTVDLSVNIDATTPGTSDNIAFNVDQSAINFGNLKAGQSAETMLSLANTGSSNIYIEASVLGDAIFTDFTSLDQNSWQNYNLNLAVASSQIVSVALSVPNSFNSTGQKTGQLIFWGVNQ